MGGGWGRGGGGGGVRGVGTFLSWNGGVALVDVNVSASKGGRHRISTD